MNWISDDINSENYLSRTSYARHRVLIKWKLIYDNFRGTVLNISVKVTVTIHGESTRHRWRNFGSRSGVSNYWWFNRPITLLHNLSADQCLESNLQPFG